MKTKPVRRRMQRQHRNQNRYNQQKNPQFHRDEGQAVACPPFVEGKRGNMATQRILPLGFVDRTTQDGAIMMLTNPNDSHGLSRETPITLQTRSTINAGAWAKIRGLITAVGYVTASFKVVETRTSASWPEGEQILRRGTPVYQALAGSFKPDLSRTLTDEEAESLSLLATRFRRATRPERPMPEAGPRPSRNGTQPDQ